MRYIFGILLTPIFYIVFGFFLGIFHIIQMIAYFGFGYSAHKKSVDALNWCLMASYYVLGNRVKYIPNAKVNAITTPIIFVANHQSMFDIPPLIWYLRKFHAKFVVKKELGNIPSLSFNLKYGGCAVIDRKNFAQAIAAIEELGEKMHNKNWSAIIFPEGTRSRTGQIKTFKSGGVGALLKNCPEAILVPVAIENSWKIVKFGKFPFSTGEGIVFKALDPIYTNGKTVEQVTKEAEDSIRLVIGQ